MFHVASAQDKPHAKKNYVKFSVNVLKNPRQYSSGDRIWKRSCNITESGSGEWYQTDMTELARDWHLKNVENHGITLEFKRDWMKNYVDVANGKNVSILKDFLYFKIILNLFLIDFSRFIWK